MKKVLISILSVVFICTFAITSVCADIIDTSSNISEGSAAALDFGDTAVLYGHVYMRYYKLTIPYNGELTVDLSASGSTRLSRNVRYVFYIYTPGQKYTQGARFDREFDSEGSLYDTASFSKGMAPGTYYLLVGAFSLSAWAYSDDNWDLRIMPTFECSHIETNDDIIVEPTCSSSGKKNIVCYECDEVLRTASIPALDHEYGDWTIEKEPSCDEVGSKFRICDECNHRDDEKIDMIDHDFDSWEITKEATCEVSGERKRICSECNKVETQTIGKSPIHEYGSWGITKEATCKATGERRRVCSVCDKVETETIPKNTEHAFGKWTVVTEATCTKDGKRTRTCYDCGYKETDVIESENEHDFGKWVIITAPTCEKKGESRRTCDICKYKETKTLDAIDHEYGEWIVTTAATESSSGVQTRYCELCDKTETKNLPRLIHGAEYEWKITEEATCAKEGKNVKFCKYCNKEMETQVIKRTAHQMGGWFYDTLPTPEKTGVEKQNCKYCDHFETKLVPYTIEYYKNIPQRYTPFTDVASTDWFKDVVGKVYHYGLMVGNSATTFNPKGNVTVAEVITTAVRIHLINHPEISKPQTGTNPWYQCYVDYAVANGIIKSGDFKDYSVAATRAQTAYIFAHCVEQSSLDKINKFTSIPDVPASNTYFNDILALYNAGILTGNDDKGTFYPDNNISRAEIAAMVARIANITERVKK